MIHSAKLVFEQSICAKKAFKIFTMSNNVKEESTKFKNSSKINCSRFVGLAKMILFSLFI